MTDYVRDENVYNMLIEKYPNSIVICSDVPIHISIPDVQKGVRVIMENGQTKINFIGDENDE